MFKPFELGISIFFFLSSIIGVFISIKYENYKIKKEEIKNKINSGILLMN